MSMFCYQCEQASKGTGCTIKGVCGKEESTSGLQDLLVYQLKGIGFLAHGLRQKGKKEEKIDLFVTEALFTTVTNVNFDDTRLVQWVRKAQNVKDELKGKYENTVPQDERDAYPDAVTFTASTSIDELNAQAAGVGILDSHPNEDIRSLQQLLVYGLKGMAAYADHAYILGEKDDAVFAFFHEALAKLNDTAPTAEELLGLNMKCGEVNIRTMELLDAGNTGHYGHPEPTGVSTGTQAGPAIIVTGHDLADLEALLKQTEGTGVNIYTHGEMLPAHGYPELKKYGHLVGHFGTAWQNQQKEFDGVPAVFLFTTNCIQKPKSSYQNQVFTCGLVGWPGVKHVENRDFSSLIAMAKELGGFEDKEGSTLTTGFGRNAVLSVADKVIDAVKSGAIKHFLLVGGCDGAKPGRNYYTKLVEQAPKDTVILTLACGKFRFNDLDLGDIGGIPRLLDIGQCNDAYSAVKIALALADAFDCGVNDLPLSLVLSWYEQKAVVILLSLLHLGITNIRIGPSLPAFITPAILNVLVNQFKVKPIATPEEDLQDILAVKG